jgi:phosphatidylinositol glycan class Q protein
MVTNDGLMRIFWPSDAVVGRSSGVLVGFRNSDLDVLVISILQDVEVHSISILVKIVADGESSIRFKMPLK